GKHKVYPFFLADMISIERLASKVCLNLGGIPEVFLSVYSINFLLSDIGTASAENLVQSLPNAQKPAFVRLTLHKPIVLYLLDGLYFFLA
ncbi:hypothetical protein AMQ83_17135, partial [Paenibacillus riograndensis]